MDGIRIWFCSISLQTTLKTKKCFSSRILMKVDLKTLSMFEDPKTERLGWLKTWGCVFHLDSKNRFLLPNLVSSALPFPHLACTPFTGGKQKSLDSYLLILHGQQLLLCNTCTRVKKPLLLLVTTAVRPQSYLKPIKQEDGFKWQSGCGVLTVYRLSRVVPSTLIWPIQTKTGTVRRWELEVWRNRRKKTVWTCPVNTRNDKATRY